MGSWASLLLVSLFGSMFTEKGPTRGGAESEYSIRQSTNGFL